MFMANSLTSQNIRREISEKLKQYRIRYPMTQKELSDKSGVSVRSISRFEGGEDIQFGNLIRILKALDLEKNLDFLVPDVTQRPSYYLHENTKRQRVRHSRKVDYENVFQWGMKNDPDGRSISLGNQDRDCWQILCRISLEMQ